MSKRKFKYLSIFIFFVGLLVMFIISIIPRALPQDLLEQAKKSQRTHQHQIKNSDLLILIDFNKPFYMKRLWLYDIANNEIQQNSYVTHAWRSGLIYPTAFSNTPASKLSCYDAFVSLESYQGEFGYALRINGLEAQNYNARKRNIVMHPTARIKFWGITLPSWMGIYSNGCFALQEKDLSPIIDQTKNGTMLYVGYNK